MRTNKEALPVILPCILITSHSSTISPDMCWEGIVDIQEHQLSPDEHSCPWQPSLCPPEVAHILDHPVSGAPGHFWCHTSEDCKID